ncbi:MAG: NAD-dependent epimerase/dehydratase family protein [Caldilineae bacterium]|nr:MAG: NAD-dependent epimerase/dehydratase family protein [Caldilineae bacterium]
MHRQSEFILVTGGAGFIGSHTVERLLDSGHRVRVLDNLSSGREENLPLGHPGLELIPGDVTSPEDVEQAMQGMDRILHLAAQVSVEKSVQQPVESCRQNILGFVQVIDAAVRHGVQRMVFASSAAVYGNPRRLPIEESHPLGPISPYGLEKQVNEEYATLFRDLHGLSVMGLRYFNVYGPRQDPGSPYAGVISIFASRMSQRKSITIYGDGRQTRDFVYVGDVARANEASLFCGFEGVCNIASGRSISLLDLVDELAEILGRVPVRFDAPRDGDIRESQASVSRMQEVLRLGSMISTKDGLEALLGSEAPSKA